MFKQVNIWKFCIAILVLAAALGSSARRAEAASCTVENGQNFIETAQYAKAVKEFDCVMDLQPTGVDGYRGKIEAELMLGKISNAARDYARFNALVLPVHPDGANTILSQYAARLAASPNNIPALTGESFARWWFFQYPQAIHTLNHLLEVDPANVYGNLLRGSSRLLQGAAKTKGIADLEYAISLAPTSPDVHFIVADAYTYGLTDPQRAFAEASLALAGGLDTPRVHAILASAYLALGDMASAAEHIARHIELVTAEYVTTAPLAAGGELNLDLVPYRTFVIPVSAAAGEIISIETGSGDFWDTIMVLYAPDGTAVAGADDTISYFAALDWVAETSGTYMLHVTSFEGVSTGELVVGRD